MTTAANVHDVTVAHELIREGDEAIYGDSGYLGLEKREEMGRFDGVEYKISRKPSSIKACPNDERCPDKKKNKENCKKPSNKDERGSAAKKDNKKRKQSSVKDEQCSATKKNEEGRKSSAGKDAAKCKLLFIAEKDEEHRNSSVRCKAEHIFLIVKRDFGYAKAMYRGLAKNAERFYMLFALANILKRARAGRGEEFCMA